MVGSGKGLATPINLAVVRTLTRVRPRVLLQIALGRELLLAHIVLAVESFTRVKAHVCRQPIPSVERLITAIFLTEKRFLAGVDTPVYLQAVRGDEGLVTSFEFAAEVVLPLVRFQVGPQITHGRVRPVATVVDTLKASRPRVSVPV